MRPENRQSVRWQRRYKLIAVVGLGAVVAVPVEWVCMAMFEKAYSLVAFACCVVCIGTGYLIEHLALLLTKKNEAQEIDFTYESKIRIPWGITVVSWIITVVLMIALAWSVGHLVDVLWLRRFGSEMSRDALLLYRLLLALAFGIAGCIGAYLRPCGFNQIVGLRSMLECIAIFAVVGALETVYGAHPLSLFFVLCMVVYGLCMTIIMNQVHVIQPSYFSHTCHATDELRCAGIRSVLAMFGLCLKNTWLPIAAMSLLIFPLRVITFFQQRDVFSWLFVFPVANAPVVNCVVFIGSFLTLIGFIVYVCWAARNPDVPEYLAKALRWIRQLWLRLRLLLLAAPSRLRKERKKKEKHEPTQDARLMYEDTVIHRPRSRPEREVVMSYGTFSRRLLALSDPKEQYGYAYRTLVACLIRKHIGIDAHTTPQDIAVIVQKRTNLKEIERITELFYASAYAPDAPAPTTGELVSLCAIVRTELERERKQR